MPMNGTKYEQFWSSPLWISSGRCRLEYVGMLIVAYFSHSLWSAYRNLGDVSPGLWTIRGTYILGYFCAHFDFALTLISVSWYSCVQSQNTLLQLARETGNIDLFELKDDLAYNLQLCDQLTYDNERHWRFLCFGLSPRLVLFSQEIKPVRG